MKRSGLLFSIQGNNYTALHYTLMLGRTATPVDLKRIKAIVINESD